MTIFIVAGGTGGHFYPGLAVAKELRTDNIDVEFIVRRNDLVVPLLQREKILSHQIWAAGFKRSLSILNLVAIFKLLLGFFQTFFLFLRRKPKVVLSMGGYLSFAPSLVAKLFGIPVMLHEQNARPGLANRFLSRIADKIALAFDESQPAFGKRTIVTGNPIRPEFHRIPSRQEAALSFGLDPNKKTVLAFGGSLGAHRLNQLVLGAMTQLQEEGKPMQILHVTGGADEIPIREAYQQAKGASVVRSYCHEMPMAYALADLVVSRAGAGAVAELMTVGKPAILIPYPFASENHQMVNAQVLMQRGCAEIMEEKKASSESLARAVERLIEKTTPTNGVRVHLDAAKRIKTELLSLLTEAE